MKKEKWFKALELVDDKYLAEANPNATVKFSTKKRITLSIIAAAACLILIAGNLWLFLPFNNGLPDVSRYSDSEYYEIIKKLNVLTYEESKYKNNSWHIVFAKKTTDPIGTVVFLVLFNRDRQ